MDGVTAGSMTFYEMRGEDGVPSPLTVSETELDGNGIWSALPSWIKVDVVGAYSLGKAAYEARRKNASKALKSEMALMYFDVNRIC